MEVLPSEKDQKNGRKGPLKKSGHSWAGRGLNLLQRENKLGDQNC